MLFRSGVCKKKKLVDSYCRTYPPPNPPYNPMLIARNTSARSGQKKSWKLVAPRKVHNSTLSVGGSGGKQALTLILSVPAFILQTPVPLTIQTGIISVDLYVIFLSTNACHRMPAFGMHARCIHARVHLCMRACVHACDPAFTC